MKRITSDEAESSVGRPFPGGAEFPSETQLPGWNEPLLGRRPLAQMKSPIGADSTESELD